MILVGGGEKLRPGARLRRAAARRLRRRRGRRRPLRRAGARPERALRAGPSRALAAGLAYIGADFRFDPPALRGGRAAVDRRDRHRQAGREDGASRAHLARLLAARARGRRRRDGPRRPAGARARRGAARRSTSWSPLSRAGRHAASDHLEVALARRRADDRLPARRRRPRRAARSSRTSSRAPGSRSSAGRRA